jgi:hypothetical protein
MQHTLKLMGEVVEQVHLSLKSAASDAKESTANLTAATKATTAASEKLAAYHADLSSAHKEMLNVFEQSRMELESQITSQLTAIDEFRTQVTHSTAQIMDGVIEAAKKFDSATGTYNDSQQEALRRVAEFREAVAQRFDVLFSQVSTMLTDHTAGMSSVKSELLALSAKFDPLTMDQEWSRTQAAMTDLNLNIGSLRVVMAQIPGDQLAAACRDLATILRTPTQNPTAQPSPTNPEQYSQIAALESSIARLSGVIDALSASLKSRSSQSTTPTMTVHTPKNQAPPPRGMRRVTTWLKRPFTRRKGE